MNFILRLKGGEGSGHRGHRGISGQRGGSLPGIGSNTPLPSATVADYVRPPDMRADIVSILSGEGKGDTSVMARELGLQHDMKHFDTVNSRWTRGAESDAKEEISAILRSNTGVRELTLYDMWSSDESSNASFEQWLGTPKTFYRGGGRSTTFMSFSMSESVARDASKSDNIWTVTLKPSQLLGSGMTGAGEVYVDSEMIESVPH